MKKNLFLEKTALLTIILLLGISRFAMASTFTASTSGNWSSATTWGAAGPGFNITAANSVIIPLGVTVTLDSDLTINNALASLAVNGALSGSTNMTLTGGTLSGAGAVTLNSLTVGTAGFITSLGNISVTQFANSQPALALGGIVNVSSMLVLNAGVVQLSTGGAVDLENNATINMAGGSYSINGGLLNLAGMYNLLYSGAVSTIGTEAGLTGLQNITVNLASASNQLSLASALSVVGILSLQQGVLNLNGNDLTINGGINTAIAGSIGGNVTSNLTVNGTGSVGALAFASGSQMLNNLTINISSGGNVLMASNLMVGAALSLNAGSLSLNGYNLTLSGTISAGGTGIIIGNATSNITINGTGTVGTLALSALGNTLAGLTIDIGAAGSVLLGSVLTISGQLALNGGNLDLNGQNLIINGAISPSGSGAIIGNVASDITFSGTGNSGTLVFAVASQTINNLIVNIGSSGSVALGSNMNVGGALTLAQGNINLGNYNLMVLGNITGGSAASYAVTSGTGTLVMTVANAGVSEIFQVGTAANYAPVSITNNSTASGSFSVLAQPGVFTQGTTGNDLSLTTSVVNTSWDVSTSIIAGANVNLEMFWNTAMQANGFDNTSAYVSHFTAGAWNTSTLAAATALGGGAFSLALTGVTSFSPFAVFDKNTTTAIDNVTADALVGIYPNPATSQLNITVDATNKYPVMKIFDVIGNEIISLPIQNTLTSLDISGFAPGMYFASFSNGATEKFIKN